MCVCHITSAGASAVLLCEAAVKVEGQLYFSVRFWQPQNRSNSENAKYSVSVERTRVCEEKWSVNSVNFADSH